MLAGVSMPPGITVLGFRSRRAVKKTHVSVHAYILTALPFCGLSGSPAGDSLPVYVARAHEASK